MSQGHRVGAANPILEDWISLFRGTVAVGLKAGDELLR